VKQPLSERANLRRERLLFRAGLPACCKPVDVIRVFHRALAHPIIPFIVAVAVVLAGHGSYVPRSGAVFICWVWFSLAIGREVYKQPWATHEKSISFVFFSGLTLVGTLVCMWWFLKSFLELRH
jgi:hypothetical protein